MRQNGSIVGPYAEPTLGPASGVHSLSTQGIRQGGNVWPLNVSALPYTTNLFAHYDAADGATIFDSNSGGSQTTNGGAVGRWEDKSGNARHLLQATANNRPVLRDAHRNGRNGIEFDGTNDGLTVVSTLTNPCTFCFVARLDKSNAVFIREDDTTVNYFGYAISAGFASASSNPTFSIRTYINGVDINGADTTNSAGNIYSWMQPQTYAVIFSGMNLSAWSGFRMAEYSGFVWKGWVYELIIFSETLSAANARTVSRYLRSKWATGNGLVLA